MKWNVNDDFVHVFTRHFTQFIVIGTDTTRKITHARLSVAASHQGTDRMNTIELRLMLHSYCAGLNDFSFNMEMVGRPQVSKEIWYQHKVIYH